MRNEVLERRALELLIRRTEAEEHVLERRLERFELKQRVERRAIETQPHDDLWRRLVG